MAYVDLVGHGAPIPFKCNWINFEIQGVTNLPEFLHSWFTTRATWLTLIFAPLLFEKKKGIKQASNCCFSPTINIVKKHIFSYRISYNKPQSGLIRENTVRKAITGHMQRTNRDSIYAEHIYRKSFSFYQLKRTKVDLI